MKHLPFVFALSLIGLLYGVSSPSATPLPSATQPPSPAISSDLGAFFLPPAPAEAGPSPTTHPTASKADSLLAYAQTLIGRPYVYGDTGENGFDCSGFTTHVYSAFGIAISRSSATQAHDGQPVSRENARKGDLIIFTGTNPSVREPGHVGIIITDPGEPISFVHSSSVGGVKISEVESTGYERRFLEVRRVL